MPKMDSQRVLVLFRMHCGLVQLQFSELNPGVLQLPDEDIRRLVLSGAASLGLFKNESVQAIRSLSAEELSGWALQATECTFPDLAPVAELAQAATLRLLYRGSAVEDTSITDVLALELTAKLSADKLGIPENAFMAWHRSQFTDDANPQEVMQNLEHLVWDALCCAPLVFLSYRRDDTELFVGQLSDRLKSSGYDVIYDVDTLKPGEEWRSSLKSHVSAANAVIVVIGKRWLSERLFDSGDPVRMEIAEALDLGKPIVPLLVNRAAMPRNEELPPELHTITQFQAAELDVGITFNEQIKWLLESLNGLTRRR